MTERRMSNDAQWLRIADLLPGKPTDSGGRAANNQLLRDRTGLNPVHLFKRLWRDVLREKSKNPVFSRVYLNFVGYGSKVKATV